MFWKTKPVTPEPPAAVAVKENMPVAPTSYSIEYEYDVEFMAEWVKLGREVGITTGKVPEVELKLFLGEEHIPVFITQACFDYLTAKAKQEGLAWHLYALRKSDNERYELRGTNWADIRNWPNGQVHENLYRDKIPYPVLVTLKKLTDKFGDRLTVFVAATKQDPFLVVTLDDSNLVFIERWDEPSFRDR